MAQIKVSAPEGINSTTGEDLPTHFSEREHSGSIALTATHRLCSGQACTSSNGGMYVEQGRHSSHRLNLMNDLALPPKKLTSDDIPVLDSFPGYYGFDLYRPLCGDAYEANETKPSTAFFYFKDESGWTNLYSKKTPTWWTLSYWCQRQPPEGSFIRLTPVYGTSDKQQEVIQRCFEDFMSMPTNSMARYSIVVVGNSSAEYFFDPVTERLCVTIPYEKPKEGCEYSQFNGRFMCFNSCLYNGGQGNKKPLFLIITLERLVSGLDPIHGQCEVLGRQCIKFRSCACPKRDKENSERRVADQSAQSNYYLKRSKDSDRSEKCTKKVRSCNLDNTNSVEISEAYFSNKKWYSPQDNPVDESHNRVFGFGIDTFNDACSENHKWDPTIVNYNGETYYMQLVPTGFPGMIDTLRSVRYGLLKAWFHASQFPSTRDLNERIVKHENSIEQNKTVSCDHSRVERSLNLLVDDIHSAENSLSKNCREHQQLIQIRGQNNFVYAGDSAASQSNSDGTGQICVENDNINHIQDYSQTCTVGSLSGETSISADPVRRLCNEATTFVHPTFFTNHLLSGAPTAQSSSLYIGANHDSHLSSCDVDYCLKFHPSSYTRNFFSPPGSTECQSISGTSQPSEIILSTDVIQQVQSDGTHESANSEEEVLSKSSYIQGRINRLPSEVDQDVSRASNTGLNHAIETSAFYSPHFFANRTATAGPITSLLHSVPREISTSTGDLNNACFYQTMNGPGLAEPNGLHEERLGGYPQKETRFAEPREYPLMNPSHHSDRCSPTYNSSSSSRSPKAAYCEKLEALNA